MLLAVRDIVATSDINLPVSLMNILWSLIDDLRAADTNQTQVGKDSTL